MQFRVTILASENLQEMMAIIPMEQRQIFFIFVQNGKVI